MNPDSLHIVVESSKQTINIFGLSIDIVVFTVLTPILIFIFGYLLNRYNDWRKEKKKLYDIRLYFYSIVETLLKATSKQKKNIDDFIKSLKEEKIQNLKFALSADFKINHINALPKTDLFSVIVNKEKKNREKRLSIFWKCQQSFDLINWNATNFKNNLIICLVKVQSMKRTGTSQLTL